MSICRLRWGPWLNDSEALSLLQNKFLKAHVEPILLDAAFDLLQAHRIKATSWL